MHQISNRIIPTEEVRRLTQGSFEQAIVQVGRLVESRPDLFGGAARVLGTFPDHAVVLSEGGRFYRVALSLLEAEVRLGEVTLLEAKTYASIHEYQLASSKEVLRALQAGDTERATERAQAILSGLQRQQPESQVVEALLASFRGPRLWKKVFAEKAIEIRQKVLDEIASIHEDRIQVKFRPLYDGSIQGAELERYRPIVVEGLQKLAQRSFALAAEMRSALAETTGSDPSVASFKAFADDLCADLSSSRKAATDAVTSIHRIDSLGRLHDALAEGFSDKQVASRFTIKMSRRLAT